jgi:peptidoglycan/LPS O-acetylase OafA/YrhL
MDRNLYIHGLRGALALSLFLFHAFNSKLPSFQDDTFLAFKFVFLSLEYGVEIFFAVSGLVIVFAFQKTQYLSKFLVDRASRIFPVLWFTVLTIYILSGVDQGLKWDVPLLTLLGNLFALPPLIPMRLLHPVAWTISYEFFFYTFFIAFGLIRTRLNKGASISILAVLAGVFIFSHLRAMPFVVGVVVALALQRNPKFMENFKFPGLAIFGAMFCWYLGANILGEAYGHVDQMIKYPAASALFLLGTCASMLGLAGVYAGNGFFSKVLASRVFQWLGTISFSFYLWQTITMVAVKKAMYMGGAVELAGPWSQLIYLALSLPLTLMVSKISQVYLEKKATIFLRQYAAQRLFGGATAAAVSK